MPASPARATSSRTRASASPADIARSFSRKAPSASGVAAPQPRAEGA